ncbi:MAG: hypothetical protein ABR503_11830 [Chitinophagaceae bacterium]
MKNSKIFLAIALLFSSLFFINCTPDNDRLMETQEIITRGNWSINYYYSDQDKTAQVNNYQFSFENGGKVICIDNNNTYEGTWRIAKNVSGDVLNMQLTTPPIELLQLNAGWNVTGKNTNSISLKSANVQLRITRL